MSEQETHELGTSVQNMGPLDGNGSVLAGLAVRCGRCNERFMTLMHLRIVDPQTEDDNHLTCPYCGTRKAAVPLRSWFHDDRNWSEGD